MNKKKKNYERLIDGTRNGFDFQNYFDIWLIKSRFIASPIYWY